jgi:hypothetical protein
VPNTGTDDVVAVWSRRTALDSIRWLVRRDVDFGATPNGAVVGAPLDFFGSDSFSSVRTELSVQGVPAGGLAPAVVTLQPFITAGRVCGPVLLPTAAGDLNAAIQFRPNLEGAFVSDLDPSVQFQDTWDPIVGASLSTAATRQFAQPAIGFRRPGDLFGAVVGVTNLESATDWDVRMATEVRTSDADRIWPLPPGIQRITPVDVPGGGYRRLRFRFVLPQTLQDAATIWYRGNGREIEVRLSRAYLASDSVDFSFPDLSAVPGWNPSFAPSGTLQYRVRGEANTRANRCAVGRTEWAYRQGVI